MANRPARGTGPWTRQRKSCSRSSCVGTPKLVTTTPRGLSAPDMCFTPPSSPAASRPCRISNTECVRAPHIQSCSSKSSWPSFSKRSRASCLVMFGGGSSEILSSLTFPGSSNRWKCIGAAYPGPEEASSRARSLVCPEDRSCRAPHVLLGRAPVAHGDPHQGAPAPDGAGEPASAVALDPFDHVLGPPVALPGPGARAFEANQHLVEHHFVDHLHAGSLREKLREQARMGAAALHQRRDSRPAQRAQGGIDGKTSRAARELRGPFVVVPIGNRALEISGAPGHRGTVCLRIANERQAAVVRHVEPFVRVGGPGIRLAGAGDEVPVAGAGRRPEAEGAVHVHPACSVLAREPGDLRQRVERSG